MTVTKEDIEALKGRVYDYQTHALPGQPMQVHMGTFYLIDDLWDALQDTLEAMEWQDISTAPDAGENVDVWVFGGRYARPKQVGSDGDFWRYEKKQGSGTIPTHWTPVIIPTAPEEDK